MKERPTDRVGADSGSNQAGPATSNDPGEGTAPISSKNDASARTPSSASSR